MFQAKTNRVGSKVSRKINGKIEIVHLTIKKYLPDKNEWVVEYDGGIVPIKLDHFLIPYGYQPTLLHAMQRH